MSTAVPHIPCIALVWAHSRTRTPSCPHLFTPAVSRHASVAASATLCSSTSASPTLPATRAAWRSYSRRRVLLRGLLLVRLTGLFNKFVRNVCSKCWFDVLV
eukprot:358164-Chlamydomonas_euryale.AAC.9